MSQIINNIKEHWLVILIILCGSFLRFYRLDELGILFGDSARDILVATSSVEQGSLPLLGIPSSVPRFRQGPLSIWLVMLLNIVVGDKLFIYSIAFAFLGAIAMIALYEYTLNYHSKKVAIIATLILSFSPLAIAHSRMIYHITATPFLVVLYLWAMQRLWHQRKMSHFWSGFITALVFQTELSLFPLFVVPIIIIWLKKSLLKKVFLFFLAGTSLGMLPQIIHDLSHHFEQLGGFALWLIYRFGAAFIPSEHQFSQQKIFDTAINFGKYFSRIWGADNSYVLILMTIILACAMFWLWKKRVSLKPSVKILLSAFIVLSIGYVVHGTPTEAYFPAYFIFLPLIIGSAIEKMRLRYQAIFITCLVMVSLFNIKEIFANNFFVSNNKQFSYGPSISEQKSIVNYIAQNSQGQIKFSTKNSDGIFPTYFDGYRYLMKQKSLTETETGKLFFIEKIGEKPIISWTSNKNINKKTFQTLDVYYFN